MEQSEKHTKGLIREYLAPAGIGAIIGAISTLATVVPQFMDKTKQIIEQRSLLAQIEQDVESYSQVVKKLYPLLSRDQLANLFEGKGKTLLNVDRGKIDDDTWISAELKVSGEGAYFVWCRSGMNSSIDGASTGFWLTRRQAMAWADTYGSSQQLRAIFGEDAYKLVDTKLPIDLCE